MRMITNYRQSNIHSPLVITHQFLRERAASQELQDVGLSTQASLVTNGN